MCFMTWINHGSMAWCQKHTWFGVQLPVGISDLCRLFDSVFVCDCLCMGEQTGGGWNQRVYNFLPVEWYLVSSQMRPNFTQKTSQTLPFLKIPDPYPQIRIHFQMQFIRPLSASELVLLYAWLYLCLWLDKARGLCSIGPCGSGQGQVNHLKVVGNIYVKNWKEASSE